MILVNLYGAPGAGKSTGAAYIFSKLKMKGINAELVTEFAKDKAWEESKAVFKNQAYIFGKQYFRITKCEDKVDVIVTDSPLLNSVIYNNNKVLGESFNQMVRNVANSYNSMNYYIRRVKPYNPNGRLQTEQESNDLQDSILGFLKKENVQFTCYDGTLEDYDKIVDDIVSFKHSLI